MPLDIPSSDLSAVVLAAFERAPAPLTLAALKRTLTKPFRMQNSLRDAVLWLVAEGRLHRWPGAGKSKKYWIHEPGVLMRAKIAEALHPEPQSAAEIAKKLKACGLSAKALEAPLKELVAGRQAYLHPPLTGSTLRWALQPPAPQQLLKKTLKAFRDESSTLARRGFPLEQLDQAARRLFGGADAPTRTDDWLDNDGLGDDGLGDMPRRLLGIMRLASIGGAIPLRELRRLTFIAKPEFDAAILALRDAGCVHLHYHDHAAAIDEDERYDLVTDGRGHYYVAAGLLAR
jgi:hypothetical protein